VRFVRKKWFPQQENGFMAVKYVSAKWGSAFCTQKMVSPTGKWFYGCKIRFRKVGKCILYAKNGFPNRKIV
jgi:hypothetical protein